MAYKCLVVICHYERFLLIRKKTHTVHFTHLELCLMLYNIPKTSYFFLLLIL